jgi:hypothetical protein
MRWRVTSAEPSDTFARDRALADADADTDTGTKSHALTKSHAEPCASPFSRAIRTNFCSP